MQVIDAHCHIWQLDRGDYDWLGGAGLAPLRRDFSLADYPGAGRVILVQAAPTTAETRFLLAQTDPRVAGVVGWVDLAAPDAAQTLHDLAADPRLKGIRPMLQDIPATDWLTTAPRTEALAALGALGLRLDALVTERHLPVLAEFAATCPDLPIVIDHAAKPQPGTRALWAEGMARLAADPRMMCKLSGLMTELSDMDALRAVFVQLLDWFGPDRLIWGSDWPVLTLAAPFVDWLALTEELLSELAPSERAAIMGGNAARFYGVAA